MLNKSFRQTSVYVVTAIFFATSFLFCLSQTTLADPSWTPFLKINDGFPDAYSLQGINSKIALPESQFQGTFRPGQKIDFAIDPAQLGLNHVAFTINTGDGHIYKTTHVVHAYDKPGSYIVKVRADKQIGQEDAQGNVDAVLVNVVPSEDYRLPKPKIAVEGKIIEGKDNNSYEVNDNQVLHLDGHSSLAGTGKITKYQWDFGDGSGGLGVSVGHKYGAPQSDLFIVLRTTDQNGLFADTYIMANIVAKTGQPSGKQSGTNNVKKAPPIVSARKTGIKGRFDSLYLGVNIWLRQTIAKLGGKGGPVPAKSIFLILVIAVFLGSLHSLTPGHSKSIMAAVLIGKKESQIKDVFTLASAITFTHTAVIYLLGIFLLVLDRTASLNSVMPYFTLLNKTLLIVLGAWLVTRGARAWLHYRRHRVHSGDNENGHSHAHSHSHDHLRKASSTWGMILAGASGGLVPCIDALSILILATSVHMVLFGLVVVLFFSLGLAASIVVLGLLVIRTKKLVKLEERVGEKIGIYAPLLTGIVIIFLGIGLILPR